MKYKIVETNPADHSIVVRFYTDRTPEASLAVQVDEDGRILRGRTDYSIGLPVPAPRGQDLEDLILRHAPVEWLSTRDLVADPSTDTSLDFLSDLVGVERVVPTARPAAQGPKELRVFRL